MPGYAQTGIVFYCFAVDGILLDGNMACFVACMIEVESNGDINNSS